MSRCSTLYTLFTIHYHLVSILCVVDTRKEDLVIIITLYPILLYSFSLITFIYYSHYPLPIFLSRWFIVPPILDPSINSTPFLNVYLSYYPLVTAFSSFHKREWD